MTYCTWILHDRDPWQGLQVASEGDHGAVTALKGKRRDVCVREIQPGAVAIPGERLNDSWFFEDLQHGGGDKAQQAFGNVSSRPAGERERHGLSDRERELLPFLARRALATQNDIGQALAVQISGRTVGAHIAHISEKLNVSGGRWAVVRAARERGLLPPDEPPSSAGDGP